MKWYFRFIEFISIGETIFEPPIDVTDKIIKNFMVPLNEIREDLGQPIYIRSCYRPHYWELKQGRDGDSQHVFKGEGAVDCSLTPHSDSGATGWKELFSALELRFNRVCWYPKQKFFHADRKGSQKLTFINRDGWERMHKDVLIDLIPD